MKPPAWATIGPYAVSWSPARKRRGVLRFLVLAPRIGEVLSPQRQRQFRRTMAAGDIVLADRRLVVDYGVLGPELALKIVTEVLGRLGL